MLGSKNIKNILLFIIKLSLSALILYFVLKQAPLSAYRQAFSLLTPKVFLLLILMVISQVFFLAYRWSYLCDITVAFKLKIGDAVMGTLVGFFFSQGLPASIGGDAYRVWWTKKRGISTREGIKIIFFDRLYGLMALVTLCALSLTLLFYTFGKINQVISLAVVVLGLSVFILLFVMPMRFGLSKQLEKLSSHLPLRFAHIFHWILQTRETLRQHGGMQTCQVLGIGLLIHFIAVLQAYWIGHILSPGKINFLICLLAIPPTLLVSYMPFSIAGWGVREASMVMAFKLYGIKAATAIMISITMGMVVIMCGFIRRFFLALCSEKSLHRRPCSGIVKRLIMFFEILTPMLLAVIFPFLLGALAQAPFRVISPGFRFKLVAIIVLFIWGFIKVIVGEQLSIAFWVAGALFLLSVFIFAFMVWSVLCWGYTTSMLLCLSEANSPVDLMDWKILYAGRDGMQKLTSDRANVLIQYHLVRLDNNQLILSNRGAFVARAALFFAKLFGVVL